MKILIVDDEPLARERLKALINDTNLGEVIGEASNGRESLELAQALNPNLILLDIHMPLMSGLEAASHLIKLSPPPAIVFTTAHDEHALEAFEANAIDYLLKPIRQNRLEKALQKAQTLTQAQLNSSIHSHSASRTHISASQRGGVQLIALENIIYLQADTKYVTVRHTEGEALIDEPLKTLEKEFAHLFVRIHRNALVSRHYIQGIKKEPNGAYRITLHRVDDQLEVSRRQASTVRKIIKELTR